MTVFQGPRSTLKSRGNETQKYETRCRSQKVGGLSVIISKNGGCKKSVNSYTTKRRTALKADY